MPTVWPVGATKQDQLSVKLQALWQGLIHLHIPPLSSSKYLIHRGGPLWSPERFGPLPLWCLLVLYKKRQNSVTKTVYVSNIYKTCQAILLGWSQDNHMVQSWDKSSKLYDPGCLLSILLVYFWALSFKSSIKTNVKVLKVGCLGQRALLSTTSTTSQGPYMSARGVLAESVNNLSSEHKVSILREDCKLILFFFF